MAFFITILEPEDKKIQFRSKELSWLSFNARLLQEADDKSVPLVERLRFLGIYSNNLDEFFRVRMATLRRLVELGKNYKKLAIPKPRKTLKDCSVYLAKKYIDFNLTYENILSDMRERGVHFVDDQSLPDEFKPWVLNYFEKKVKPRLYPVMVKNKSRFFYSLRDRLMYLAIKMLRETKSSRSAYAILEIPTELDRFVFLPMTDNIQRVIYLDDVIRLGLPNIFSILPYNNFKAYAIKFTRDAEIEFDNDFTESLYDKVSEGIKARETARAVRVNYDESMPEDMLNLLLNKLNISGSESIYPGARYHNRRDFMGFTLPDSRGVEFESIVSSDHYRLPSGASILKKLKRRDILLHLPYHSFDHFLDFLRESAIDPLVRNIKLTQYRAADNSAVAKALINAARNGKRVEVMVEPRARFDEQANIEWADLYQESGIQVRLGIPKLKVHAKLCLVTRKESGKMRHYAAIGTGNFNEQTARYYTDHLLLTADTQICQDVAEVFDYFRNYFKPPSLRKLIVSPFVLRNRVREWIQSEIEFAKKDEKAEICLKLNNLSDTGIVEDLWRAARAGVKIRLIVRSMFSIVLDSNEEGAENINAISILDRFLEHTRFFIFNNGGDKEYYISSADFLPRNFEGRVEIVAPVKDTGLRKQLQDYFEIQWQDSVKARRLDTNLTNTKRGSSDQVEGKASQAAISEFIQTLQ